MAVETPTSAAAAPAAVGALAKELVPSKAAQSTAVAAVVLPIPDVDGSVQQQITRSVGRAANKAADLLANLPALPSFRRRKD